MNTEFWVDRKLFSYKDSIEIPSAEEKEIFAHLTVLADRMSDSTVEVRAILMVKGNFEVEYKGNTYTERWKFPGELNYIIKSGQLPQHKDVIVHSRNWFEVSVERKQEDCEDWEEIASEVVICDWKNPGDVFNLLLNYADNYCRDFINA